MWPHEEKAIPYVIRVYNRQCSLPLMGEWNNLSFLKAQNTQDTSKVSLEKLAHYKSLY